MKEDLFSLEVDSNQVFSFGTEDLKNLDLVSTPEGDYHIIHDSKSIEVRIIKSDLNNKTYTIEMDGVEHTVRIKGKLDLLIDKMGLSKIDVQEVQYIYAPMPGLILDLMVKEGQEVNENDALLILEAMKMENVIKSPRKGIIRSIPVEKGEAIDKSTLLIEFEK
ncbi:MAG: acetyl-CoA carboxylase biotin carboxyl carrier protein subunit [Bacteroidia bacterium]|nr:acetyl-CoA carboxylase biotin carboxyl carrier protein subunit [Bacteroidia bacterium]